MAVIIGSARSDERGKATGGKAGDQTGREVMTQNWYLHSEGWVCLRAKDPAKAALIAKAMKAACANNKIGYDQNQNQTLYNLAKNVGFDPAKVTTACETDCARLVRVCVKYAGIDAPDFYTASEVSALMSTGMFDKLTESKYTKVADYLRAGDILVTKTKGHTVVVLTNGSKADYDGGGVAGDSQNPYKAPKSGSVQKQGAKGESVYWLQWELRDSGDAYLKVDGQFGNYTKNSVKAFQGRYGLVQDGEVGNKTRDAMRKYSNSPVTVLPTISPTTPIIDAGKGIIIDVSYCDNVDWKKVAAITGDKKVIFAILRAQGKGLDTEFAKNVRGCEANGILYGVYTYSYSGTESDAIKEAENLYNRVKTAGAKPRAYYLDAEEGKNTTKCAAAFLNRIKQLVGNVYVGFYSFDSRCNSWKSTVEKFDGVWSARWNNPDIAPNYKNYDLWQFGMTKVAGVGSKTDTSRLRPGLTLEQMLNKRAK